MVASESVALEGTGHVFERNLAPGEAVFIDLKGHIHAQQCAEAPSLHPCIFEFCLSGTSRLCARWHFGLSGQAESGRDAWPSASSPLCLQMKLTSSSRSQNRNPPQRHAIGAVAGPAVPRGFCQNRYVGRTFIMPGQEVRKNPCAKTQRHRQRVQRSQRAAGGRLIVRGTTSREIVQMARDAGARKVYLASAAPPVRFPNVYGIDMPTQDELVAHNRTAEQVRHHHRLRRPDLPGRAGMKSAVMRAHQPSAANAVELAGLTLHFCFDGGLYVTGGVSAERIAHL